MRRKPVAQNRSIPNMKSSITVTAAEISNEPRQPNRFEKKKNMVRPQILLVPELLVHRRAPTDEIRKCSTWRPM
jgi:hypothetical protein